MQNIFSIQSQIFDPLKTYLPSLPAYSAFYWNWQQAEQLEQDQLPAVIAFIGSSTPADGDRFQNQDGSHEQVMKITLRLFIPKPYSTTLEAIADSLYNDVITCVAANNRGSIRQIANPTLNYMFAVTSQVQTADLEIPIVYFTNSI